MSIRNYFILFFIAASNLLVAQNSIKFEFDYARFSYDSTSSYLEVYYSFTKSSLMPVEENGVKKVEAILHIAIQDTTTKEYVVNRDWKLADVITDEGDNSKDQVGVLGFVVPTGVYTFDVIGKDNNNPESIKTTSEKLEIESYVTNEAKISDIELSSRIITDDADPNSIFFKNTLEIIPNPARLFSNETPVLFYYAEIYNLMKTKSVYKLEKLLYSSSGTNYYKKSKIVNPAQNSIVDIGLINLSKYPSDSYNLVLSLIDTTTNSAFVSLKRFYLYNPGVEDKNQNKYVSSTFSGSEFSVMTLEECDDLFSKSLYLASTDERERWEDLEKEDQKQHFLYDFWKARDLLPETPENEFKREYLLRVAYADKNFTTKLKPGYKSDRGRVYIIYGPPNERELAPFSQDHKPYEVWTYHQIEGGVSFTFGDITSFGNYELLHSTKRGEVYDEGWRNRLKMTDDNYDDYGM